MKTTFGTRLRELRERAGVNRSDFAARVKLAPGYLEKMERGYCAPPSSPAITDIVRALQADGDELFALSGKVSPDVLRRLVARPALVLAVRALEKWDAETLRGFLVAQGIESERLEWASMEGPELKNDERRVQRDPVTEELRRTAFQLDGHECVYCSSTVLLQVDHIQPVTLGGTNDIENLVTCCGRCNKKKGNRAVPFTMVFGRFREEVLA